MSRLYMNLDCFKGSGLRTHFPDVRAWQGAESLLLLPEVLIGSEEDTPQAQEAAQL